MKGIIGGALFFATALLAGQTFAQVDHCGTDEHFGQWAAENPLEAEAYQQHLAEFNERVGQGSRQRDGNDCQIVPVVIHVFHDGCVGKIGMAQVLDGLDVLNDDFRRRNSDADMTREVFQPIAADSEIEFRLARKDPDGNPTTGVVYYDTPETYDAGNNVKGLSRWPSSEYMNIWVVESIQSFGGGGGIINGYAQFPGTGGWANYGIVIRNPVFGRIGTSNADGRTLTHEVGHCFGLAHTFQSGCGSNCNSSGDFVCDTPPVAMETYNCSQAQNSCANDALGSAAFSSNVVDQIENYMSYDDCQNLFTLGQKERMKETLDDFNTLINLTSVENLQNTGVYDMTQANFRGVGSPVTVAGKAKTIRDASLSGATGWDWEFEGSWPDNTSTEKNPSIFYTTPGIHDVTLSASNATDTKVRTKENFMLVGSIIGKPLPFSESFEGDFPNDTWITYNPDEDTYFWDQTDIAASHGSKSMKMVNHGNCGTEVLDELITTSLDFSPYEQVTISFETAYARRSTTDADYLQILISEDGGESWIPLWGRTGMSLETSAMSNVPFTPDATEWAGQSFTTTNFRFRKEGMIVKFAFRSGNGNHLYLDNLNFSGVYKEIPVQESPKDHATDQDATTLLNWKAVADVDAYEYQFDEINTFSTSNLKQGTLTYIDDSPLNSDTEIEVTDLDPNKNYYWRIRAIKNGTPTDWSTIWDFEVSANGVGIEVETLAFESFSVFPNPTNAQTNISFHLEKNAEVKLQLVDLLGREIKNIASANLSGGAHNFQLQTDDLKNGIYLLHLNIEGRSATKKLIVN